MAQHYASKQPQGFKNHIEKVAIVGAGGQIGKVITAALLKSGKQTLTAITRTDSTNSIPHGPKVVKVDYSDHVALTEALRGHDMLIVTMSVMAPPESQLKLIDAAIDAKVPWIIPNSWGTDRTNSKLMEDCLLEPQTRNVHERIANSGTSAGIYVSCSFWYEYSLGGWMDGKIDRFGFNLGKRSVVFNDKGKQKISTSTFPQTGRAVAALLNLKILPEDESDKSPTLSQFRNGSIYVSSFTVSQKDMFASLKRVTGTTDTDWKIEYEPSEKRYTEGVKQVYAGDRAAYGKLLYARVFYPNGDGDYSDRLHNELLGLPVEDLDEATKIAVETAGSENVPEWTKGRVNA